MSSDIKENYSELNDEIASVDVSNEDLVNDQDLKNNNFGSRPNGEWFDEVACEESAYKSFDIYVPVSVKPYAHVYKPIVKSVGEMRILSDYTPCSSEYESCEFALAQKVCIKLPVKYGVLACYSNMCVDEIETIS